jgi:hypothetical protein
VPVKRSRVAVGFAVVACGLAIMMWTRPSRIHVERTGRVAARCEALYPLLMDFAHWNEWTPWPEDGNTFSEDRSGPGAWCRGGMALLTIVRVEPNRRVELSLEFPGVTQEAATLAVVLAPAGESTDVTWTFDSSTSFADSAFGTFQEVDGRLGRDFEHAIERLGEAARETTE